MTVRKIEPEDNLEQRTARLEQNLGRLVRQTSQMAGLLSTVTLRMEGLFAGLADARVFDRRQHALFTKGFKVHEQKVAEIRKLPTAKERVQKAADLNSTEGSVRFTVFLEDLDLYSLLADENQLPKLPRAEVERIMESGVPYTCFMAEFFRQVYCLERIEDAEG